ncbi:hypothetical protein L1987_73768 [Smallanthus sonchifolius]|uniref:Uncharacterized protein n=1 Tax=Smallanthus sonchifolius TaxID=185202 RepID=A0ACB9A2D8_9ASTR|nr:hypothetical protein L1987_73768 [Smallanthus sonchifolius]
MNNGAVSNTKWLYDSPVYSDVEAKLRHFLVESKNADRILGIQVCAYKDGQVIIDTAAGVLGKDDPRPVQPNSLFPVFSVTKGITAGMIHWLADKGYVLLILCKMDRGGMLMRKLKLDDNVANIWLEFGTNGKDQIKVNHVLNHTSGLHNALAGISEEDHALFCDFDECLKRIAMVAPETEPGHVQLYHYHTYGWLCGGIIEHASGKKFQHILDEAIARPLNVEGELYIGISPGVESRFATLTIDPDDLILLDPEHEISKSHSASLPSSYTFNMVTSLIPLSNTLNVRRAIQPAANGHFSARAIARYYATLADGGVVPPRHPSSSIPPLESQPTSDEVNTRIFTNPKGKIHDAFLGGGDYKGFTVPDGKFGLGFMRFNATDGSVIGVGHPGLGGSTGYCDINNRFAIAVTINKLSLGALTEAKLRRFLIESKNADRIVGIQVCAYKDGQVIIDTAAGVLGKDDPRPVHPNILFPVFSVTKGVTAGMVHWLADKGKLKLEDNVANIWPEFGTNGKHQIKVNHVLNHTSGLHNAFAGICEEDDTLFCDYGECLKRIAMVAPETKPGREQLYHYLSYGWLCGGIIEHASGKKFQDILEEAFIRPLNVEGEFYIGIPPDVDQSRLATLDPNDFLSLDREHDTYKSSMYTTPMPSSFTPNTVSSLISLLSTLNACRAIQPASNGHFSARAVARYYAALVDGGVVPPRHPASSLPPLESHPNNDLDTKIFTNPKGKIHDAFLGGGEYKALTVPDGMFGLGFMRFNATDGSVIGVGHPGLGGSTGYCDINDRFAIAVTVNKLSLGALTGEIVKFVSLELDLPVPEFYD